MCNLFVELPNCILMVLAFLHLSIAKLLDQPVLFFQPVLLLLYFDVNKLFLSFALLEFVIEVL